MFSSKERKMERLNSMLSDSKEINANVYNLVIGAMVAYGLIVNIFMVSFFSEEFMNINPWVFIIGYFISCIVGSIIAAKSNNPFISFIGYNLIVVPIGILLCICLPDYSSTAILPAIVITSVIVVVMMVLATVAPQFFRGLGTTLFVVLLVNIIVELIAVLAFGYNGNLFNWIAILVFSGYIGYDWCKAQDYPKTFDNAIDSAIDIYLDIINLFIRILEIIGDD